MTDTSAEAVARLAAMCESASHDERLSTGAMYAEAAATLRGLSAANAALVQERDANLLREKETVRQLAEMTKELASNRVKDATLVSYAQDAMNLRTQMAAEKAQLEQARADAARYRFLREDSLFEAPVNGIMVWPVVGSMWATSAPCYGPDLDAVIDAALAGNEQP